jgi:hypothetical protein
VAFDFPLRVSLDGVGCKMMIDFKEITAEIEHRGAKGREREALIAKAYLDRRVGPGCAEHLDPAADGRGGLPPDSGGVGVWAHRGQEPSQRRRTGGCTTEARPGQGAEEAELCTSDRDMHWGMHAYGKRFEFFPMYGVIFAYTSMALETICSQLWQLQGGLPLDHWVDAVVVLDRGLLLYRHPDTGMEVRPQPGSSLIASARPRP